MGNVVDLFTVKKNDIMVVCEEYFKGNYSSIPNTEEYKDEVLKSLIDDGAVFAVNYEEFQLVPFITRGMLKMKALKDVMYFEISTAIGTGGPFNKLTPIYKEDVDRKVKHYQVRFVSDRIKAVCLKQAYVDGELVPAEGE